MAIKQLSEEVSSKIAAGEVVERPFSVVKELLENAIDAGSSEIHVRIEQAGLKKIEMIDNGSGISREDVRLAMKRYATSKISDLNDLEKIESLGFRGEALASIAAVSRFTISTFDDLDTRGIKIFWEGGMEKSCSDISMIRGTRIQVEDLFFNTPVRKKFLKKEITERRLISELISRYALFYSSIRIHFESEGKTILLTAGNNERKEVLAQIYDLDTAKNLLVVDESDQDIHVQGFTSPINLTRSNRKEIFFFINGRLISDNSLTSAVIKAYQGLMMVARYPITALFISMPAEKIDVNVHPAKAEVRFQDSGKIFHIVHSAIRKTVVLHSPQTQLLSPTMWHSNHKTSNEMVDPAWHMAEELSTERDSSSINHQQYSFEKKDGSASRLPILRPIGQIGRKYIVSEGPDGIYLIDQHAAHERILFEKMSGLQESEICSQYFLEPIMVELSSVVDEQLKEIMPLLIKLGFQVREFGPRSYLLEALPMIVKHMDPKEALLSVLEQDADDEIFAQEKTKVIISRICKKAAVKAGQVLTAEEQERLIRDLEDCQSPRTCPHGRPTMIHLSVDLLERQFGRRGSI